MGESAMTQEVVWGVDKIELEKSILSVILQKKVNLEWENQNSI